MPKLTFLIIIITSGLTMSCNNRQQKKLKSVTDNLTETKFKTTKIDCDSIYHTKGYEITLAKFDTTVSEYDTTYNTIFTLKKNGGVIFSDSIHNAYQNIFKFRDFNGDSVKDILIQNISSANSDMTYTLFLIDTINDKIKKVKGFEQIFNPHYLPKYDLIDNYVLSGKNWTSFYKIEDDTIKDFGIVIYDNRTGEENYDTEYKNAIKSILTKEKNRR